MSGLAALAELGAAGVRAWLRDDGTITLHSAAPPPPDVLALARMHRDGIAALLRQGAALPRAADPMPPMPPTVFAPPPISALRLPGVPAAWCGGVTRLATMQAPDSIALPRWHGFRADAARLLRDHGAALHAAEWDALTLFGLHPTAPATYPPGWGLAWLLGEHGEVLDVAPDAVGMRREPDGARLAYRRPGATARAVQVPAWLLGTPGS